MYTMHEGMNHEQKNKQIKYKNNKIVDFHNVYVQ